jgi:hypothetical protein
MFSFKAYPTTITIHDFYDQINDALNISLFPFQIKYTVEEIENGRRGCK